MQFCKLHLYQTKAVAHILENPKCALFLGMGLGKTVSALTAIQIMRERDQINHVLVIAPKRVAIHTWPSEIAHWSHTAELSYAIAVGKPAERMAAIQSKPAITIINRENVPWLIEQLHGQGLSWHFDMVVVDESSSFKNPTSKRFRALKATVPYTKRCVLLTGTPSPNGMHDLWSQMYLLDEGARLGRTISAFRALWFRQNQYTYRWEQMPGCQAWVQDRIRDLCLSMTADDYLDLPEIIHNRIEVDLPPKIKGWYANFKREFLLELDEDEIVVSAANTAVLAGKLQQVAQGAIYTEKDFTELHSEKLGAVQEVLDGESGPILCGYQFKSDLKRLLKEFPFATVLDHDPQTINRWNDGEIRLLLCHPASAGHGLNLQRGGNTLVWFGLPWSLELVEQFEKRLHRQGQTKPVIVHRIIATDTVDEIIEDRLAGKLKTQQELINALKDHAA